MLLLKYKPGDLGLRLQGLIAIIPVIIISAVANRLICPTRLTWDSVVSESGGIIGALYTGFILAGLSEEFFRAIGQTRIGALINNKGIAWFSITVLWAFMHLPKWYGEEHNIEEATLGAIRIIPIGLMWGYMTHRTKSFMPAVIIHGTNFWGLQNF
jgi:membrane protease YdiL (CAAX protease family)